MTKLRFKVKPWPHQREALHELLTTNESKRLPGGGLQVPMRYGKTAIAINYAAALYLKYGVNRALVVTVVSGLGVWESEIAKHCPVPWIIVDRHGEIIAEDAPDLLDPLAYLGSSGALLFRIVNYEQTFSRKYGRGALSRTWRAVPNRELEGFLKERDRSVILVDEVHRIGNPTTKAARHCFRLRQRCRFVCEMTGTAYHRRPEFIFGQAKLMSEEILGSSFSQYKRRICIMGGFGGYEVVAYRDLDWVMKRLKPWIYVPKRLPKIREPIINTIPFHLTGKNLKLYAEMEKEAIIDLEDGTEVEATIVLAKHTKLLMMCGGWVKDNRGKSHRIGRDKLNAATARLEEYLENGIEKVVVGCRFRRELLDVARAARALGFTPVLFHGGVPKGRARDSLIARFQSSRQPSCFVTQVRAATESIDLSSASVMMHYSLSASYVDHDQFSRRIERYAERRTLMHDILTGVGTRDELALEAMTTKQDVAQLIRKNPKKVELLLSKVRRELERVG